MAKDFCTRFEIAVPVDEARKRFINRVVNIVFEDFMLILDQNARYRVERFVVAELGDEYEHNHKPLKAYCGNDFAKVLEALEAIYKIATGKAERGALDAKMEYLMNAAETDLGIRWRNGKFYKAGAEELDKALVNDVLTWLKQGEYGEVKTALEHGLNHFMSSVKRPELRKDVITDAYEALESMSKIVIGKDKKDLSANREKFLAAIDAPQEVRDLMKSYIDFGCEYRHGAGAKTRPVPSDADTEMYLYLTGAFLRRAVRAREDIAGRKLARP